MRSVCILLSLFLLAACQDQPATKEYLPAPSRGPSKAQAEMIERKYGMFICFSINTFHDMEWTDGSQPASSYYPTVVDADQWIRVARDAGMKYVLLLTKHHDGFCLWDSELTDYDVASSGNRTNVVEAVAKACKKYDIGLGLYYSMWDRSANGNDYPNGDQHPHYYREDPVLDTEYNTFMLNQLDELMDITEKYTSIVEFWFDGGWVKENYRWPLHEIYQTVKSREPDCLIGVNWSIGLPDNPDQNMVLPADLREGYPIRYFPSDFRMGDPYLPGENDPKIYTHEGKEYYMPWETTICMSQRWFFNTTDTVFKPIEELVEVYKIATAQDNYLLLNCPPNRDGVIRDKDIEILMEIREKLSEI